MTDPTPAPPAVILLVVGDDGDTDLLGEDPTDSGNSGPVQVTRCRSIAEASALLTGGLDVGCVVLDLGLPDRARSEAVEEIRVSRPGVPVIAVDRGSHAGDLREARRELHDFAHRTAHDLKSPMSVVVGALDLLERASPGDDTSDIVDLLVRSSTRVVKTVDRLLEYADAVSSEGDLVTVDLDRVLDGVIETLETELAGVSLHIARPLPSVLGTEIGLRHVFLNLLENAVTFAEPARPLRVDVAIGDRGPDRVELTVTDNGRGIPPEHRSAVFRPGYRVDRASPGSGMGLATVRRTMDGFDGVVAVETGPDDTGTRFRLEFRRSDPLR